MSLIPFVTGHLNPAVTVAVATLGKLPWRKVREAAGPRMESRVKKIIRTRVMLHTVKKKGAFKGRKHMPLLSQRKN